MRSIAKNAVLVWVEATLFQSPAAENSHDFVEIGRMYDLFKIEEDNS